MKTVIEDFVSNKRDFEIQFHFSNGEIKRYFSSDGCLDLTRKDDFIFYNRGVENELINLANVNYITLLPVIDG